MHKIESREISNWKYLSKTILACCERKAKKRSYVRRGERRGVYLPISLGSHDKETSLSPSRVRLRSCVMPAGNLETHTNTQCGLF